MIRDKSIRDLLHTEPAGLNPAKITTCSHDRSVATLPLTLNRQFGNVPCCVNRVPIYCPREQSPLGLKFINEVHHVAEAVELSFRMNLDISATVLEVLLVIVEVHHRQLLIGGLLPVAPSAQVESCRASGPMQMPLAMPD